MITKLFNAIRHHFRYLPCAVRRLRIAGALSIVGTPNTVRRGVETAESGIICRRFVVRYFPEVNDRLEGITGEAIVRAISAKFSRDITCEGEVVSSAGLMAFTLATAISFANDVNTFDTANTAGLIFLDEATETQERGGWRSVSIRASANPLLTATGP